MYSQLKADFSIGIRISRRFDSSVFDQIIIFIYPRMIVPGILTNIKMFSEKERWKIAVAILFLSILLSDIIVIEVAKRIPN